ncbi:MAG: acyltransferase [bacterium]
MITVQNTYKENRIPELDGIRGVAILLVILWHYVNNQLVKNDSGIISFILKLTSNCLNGVDLFFVLSGFLIGGILLKYKNSKNYFKTFYLRRIFRIFPLYYTVLGLYIILYFSIPNITQIMPVLFTDTVPIWSFTVYCQNFLMALKYSFGPGWLGVTWSLAIEEQFYLFLPLLIFILNRQILTIVVILLIIAATVLRYFALDNFQMHLLFQYRMDSLFTGVLLAIMLKNLYVENFLKSQKKLIYTLFLILLIVYFLFTFEVILIPHYLTFFLFNTLFAIFIIIPLLFKDSRISKFLRNKILRQIGVISYGIYLFHMIIIYFIYWVLGKNRLEINNNLLISVIAVVAFGFTLLLSFVSFYFFENKIIKYGHKYKY